MNHIYQQVCILNHMTARRRFLMRDRAKLVVRPRELPMHPEEIRRLVKRGDLQRVGRGRYVLPDIEPSENFGFALAAVAAPRAVVCLLSALRFHGIGTQAPREIWIAVERGTSRPRVDYPPVRVAIFTGSAFRFGIERHLIDRTPVRIYSAAKTVADCFKYRHKIGLDIALEALREGLRARKFTRDALWSAAKVCRVTAVVRPYLEAM
jgi:predicted transcriptional regulator of viral defense system